MKRLLLLTLVLLALVPAYAGVPLYQVDYVAQDSLNEFVYGEVTLFATDVETGKHLLEVERGSEKLVIEGLADKESVSMVGFAKSSQTLNEPVSSLVFLQTGEFDSAVVTLEATEQLPLVKCDALVSGTRICNKWSEITTLLEVGDGVVRFTVYEPGVYALGNPSRPSRPSEFQQKVSQQNPGMLLQINEQAKLDLQPRSRVSVTDVVTDVSSGKSYVRVERGLSSIEINNAEIQIIEGINIISASDEIVTEIAIVNGAESASGTLRLAKTIGQSISGIVRCEEITLDGECTTGWQETNIPFNDFGSYVEFSVEGFSAYGGLGDLVVLNAVYTGFDTMSATSNDLNVTLPASINSSRSFIITGTNVTSNAPQCVGVTGQITNSTTIRFQRISAACTGSPVGISWYVAEFTSGVIVQRGSTSMNGVSSAQETINSVDTAKSFPLISYRTTGTTFGNDDIPRARLFNSTRLDFNLNTASGVGATVEWQVIEMQGTTVQAGNVSFTSGLSEVNATITSANLSRSWLVYSYDTDSGTATNIGQKMIRGQIVNETQIRFDRAHTGTIHTLHWYLIELPLGTAVQQIHTNMTGSDLSITETVSAFNTETTMASGGLYQHGGRTDYTGDDNPGTAWVSIDIDDSTSVSVTRGATGSAEANITWFLIDFGEGLPLNVTLTATDDPVNSTSANLTATLISPFSTGTHIYDWRLEGTSIAVLNMPFDTNSSSIIKDYSTYGNNGTNNNALWNVSGKIGGAYTFNGSTYISVPDNNSLDTGNAFTLMAWINAVSTSPNQKIIVKGSEYEFDLSGDSLRINHDGSAILQSVSYTNAGSWHHVAAVYDNAENYTQLCIDGICVYEGGETASISGSSNAVAIARESASATNFFTGSMDDIRIYNFALNESQIYQIFLEGNNSANTGTIVSQETTVGDNWSVVVTPNNYSQGDGTSLQSNVVTINEDVDLGTPINSCGNVSYSGEYYLSSGFTMNQTPCITVLADNITIDGAGKEITYNGSSQIAFDIYGRQNITIHSINISVADRALNITRSANVTLRNSTLYNNWYGFYVYYSNGTVIEQNIILNNLGGYGGYMEYSINTSITQNNADYLSSGILFDVYRSNSTTIEYNNFTNGTFIYVRGSGYTTSAANQYTTIQHNRFIDANSYIYIEGPKNVTIYNNSFQALGATQAIALESFCTVNITNNTISGPDYAGITWYSNCHRAVISGNTIQNTTGFDIEPSLGGTTILFQDNTISEGLSFNFVNVSGTKIENTTAGHIFIRTTNVQIRNVTIGPTAVGSNGIHATWSTGASGLKMYNSTIINSYAVWPYGTDILIDDTRMINLSHSLILHGARVNLTNSFVSSSFNYAVQAGTATTSMLFENVTLVGNVSLQNSCATPVQNRTLKNIEINGSLYTETTCTAGTALSGILLDNVTIRPNSNYYALNFTLGAAREYAGTEIRNSNITSFTLNTNITQFLINQTALGAVRFSKVRPLNTTNLSSDVRFGQNWAYINESVSALNVTANITLLGVPVYTAPELQRNGVACGSLCTNTTALSGTVFFNVSKAGNYSVVETASADPPYIDSVVLNATDNPVNSTNANLTVYPLGAENYTTLIHDWRVDNVSVAIAQYAFDTNISTTTYGAIKSYSSVSNTNATLGNGTAGEAPTWNASGISGGAYTFDGINDWITLNWTTITGNYTYHAWINTRQGNGSIIEERIEGNDRALYIQNNQLRGGFWNAGSPYTVNAGTVSNNTWVQVVHTWDGTTLRNYVNGTLRGSSTPGVSPGSNTVYWRGLGIADTGAGWIGGLDYYFNGSIDQVMIFDRALSAEQISAMYNSGAPKYNLTVSQETDVGENWSVVVTPNNYSQGDGTSATSNDLIIGGAIVSFEIPTPDNDTLQSEGNVTINTSIEVYPQLHEVIFNWNGTNYSLYDDSLVLMMNFDNVSAIGESNTVVADVSGTGNAGTVVGGNITSTNTYFNQGRSMQFSGNGQYVEVNDSNSLDLTSEFTISAWVYTIGRGNAIYSRIVSKWTGGGGGNNNYQLWIDSTGATLSTREVAVETTGGWVGTDYIMPLNSWQHLVWTHSYSDNSEKLYANGVEVYSGAYLGNASTGGINVLIGSSASDPYPFNGSIDEVGIWNRSLTAGEINQLYMTQLRQVDANQWLLYINQTKNSTQELDDGTYTYQVFAANTGLESSETEERTITIAGLYVYNSCTVDPSQNLIITGDVVCNGETIIAQNLTVSGNFTVIGGTLNVQNTYINDTGQFFAHNSSSTIWQNGDLDIYGNYTLDNSTLRINGTTNGGIGIFVNGSGNMVLDNSSTVTNGEDAAFRYDFLVNGTLTSTQSRINASGWNNADNERGLTIYGDADIDSTIITNSYSGIDNKGTFTFNDGEISSTTVAIRTASPASTSSVDNSNISGTSKSFYIFTGGPTSITNSNLGNTFHVDSGSTTFNNNVITVTSGASGNAGMLFSWAGSAVFENTTINVSYNSGTAIDLQPGSTSTKRFKNLTIFGPGSGISISGTGGDDHTFDNFTINTTGTPITATAGIRTNFTNANIITTNATIVSIATTGIKLENITITPEAHNYTALSLSTAINTTINNVSIITALPPRYFADISTSSATTIANSTLRHTGSQNNNNNGVRIQASNNTLIQNNEINVTGYGVYLGNINRYTTIQDTTVRSRSGNTLYQTGTHYETTINRSIIMGSWSAVNHVVGGGGTSYNTTIVDSTLTGGSTQLMITNGATSGFWINRTNMSSSFTASILLYGTANTEVIVQDSILADEVQLGQSAGATIQKLELINTTYPSYDQTSCDGTPNCNLTIKWYVDVNATDGSGTVVEGADVNATDVSNNLIYQATTASNGRTGYQIITEKEVINTVENTFQNTTISANKTGHVSNSTSINITSTRLVNITLYEEDPDSGILNVTITSPTSDSQVIQNETITFTVNVSCSEGNCGDVTVTLDPPSWWNGSWEKRINITFNNSASTENLVNFPVLVILNSSNIDYTLVQNNGEDIRFIDEDDTTTLDYEIEVWNETGNSYVWVRVPQIDSASATDHIYLYYNNSAASDAQNAQGVWNNDYLAVWHFNDDPSGSAPQIIDSTSNAVNGNTSGSMSASALVTGIAGGALKMDGINDEVNFSAPTALQISGDDLTLEAWMKGPYSTLTTGGMSWKFNGSTNRYYGFRVQGTRNIRSYTTTSVTGENTLTTSGSVLSDTDWNLVTLTYNGSLKRILLDGTQSTSAAVSGNLLYNGMFFMIEQNVNYPNNTFDEIRISNVTRSDYWINATYKNLKDTFNTYGNEEGIIKTGQPVSTIVGDQPFWTSDDNPYTYSTESCLENMTNNSCTLSWSVNATGPIDTSHIFYAIVESSRLDIPDNYSNNITVDIIAESLNVCINETSICYATITEAVAAASAGQTVIITDGDTYTEGASITVGKALAITSNGSSVPIIWSNNHTGFSTGNHQVNFTRLIFNHTGTASSIYAITGTKVRIQDSEFYRNTSGSNTYILRLFGTYNENFIERSNFTTYSGGGADVQLYLVNVTVNNSRFLGAKGAFEGTGPADGITMENVFVNKSSDPGIGTSSNNARYKNITVYSGDGLTIYMDSGTAIDSSYLNRSTGGSAVWVGENATITNTFLSAGSGVRAIGMYGATTGWKYFENVTTANVQGMIVDGGGSALVTNITIVNSDITPSNTIKNFNSASDLANISYQNFLHVSVNDSAGSAVSGATVSVTNNASIEVDSSTTSGSGVTEYRKIQYANTSMNNTITITEYHDNHTITVSKQGYIDNSTSVNMSSNQNISLTLYPNLPVCVNETGFCFATIQEAVDNATSGQTVVITDEGIYEEKVSIEKHLTLTSNGTNYPTIFGNDSDAINSSNSSFARRIQLSRLNIMASGSANGISAIALNLGMINITDVNVIVNLTGTNTGAIYDYGSSGTQGYYKFDRTNITVHRATFGVNTLNTGSNVLFLFNNSKVEGNASSSLVGSDSTACTIFNSTLNNTGAGSAVYCGHILINRSTIQSNSGVALAFDLYAGTGEVNDSTIISNSNFAMTLSYGNQVSGQMTLRNSTVISGGSYAVRVGSWNTVYYNFTAIDSTFNKPILPYGGGGQNASLQILVINTSLRPANFTTSDFSNGDYVNITLQQYLDVYVNDSSGSAISGASVAVYDNTSALANSATTEGTGYITRQNVTYAFREINSTYDSTTNLTLHTVTTSKSRYDSNSTSVNMTSNQNIALTLYNTPVVVTLNATDHPTNSTAANLTAYVENASVDDTRIYTWSKNNTPYEMIYYPFDNNVSSSTYEAVRDYANAYNATLGNATGGQLPLWNASGIRGGAYTFNGSTYITGPDIPTPTDLTISVWFNPGPYSGASKYITQTDLEFQMFLNSNGTLRARFNSVDSNAVYSTINFTSAANANRWHHVVFTFNDASNELKLYHNGTLHVNRTTTNSISGNSVNLTVGRGVSDTTNFNGSIDEIRIYNRTLTPEQIYQLYIEGSSNLNTSIIVSNETTSGETWNVCVTPAGVVDDAETVCSNNLTISANNPPTVPTLLLPEDNNYTVFERYPTFNWTQSTDPEGDPITYQWNITSPAGCAAIPIKNTTSLFYVSVDKLCTDQTYNWTVRACDDSNECSEWATQFNFTIESVIGVTFTTAETAFGTLQTSLPTQNITNDTIDDNPTPLIYNNSGNVDITTTIRADQALWSTQPLNTTYWQYEDQDNTDWNNITNTYTNLLANLTIATLREIEIRIWVPQGETPGAKTGTIRVLGASNE